MRSFAWASTPLGAPAEWPSALKTAVSILLGCQAPLSIWWGPELVQLCNDACAATLGARHAEALGRPASDVWCEAWAAVGTRARAALSEGFSHREQELPLLLNRSGQPEEVYLTLSYGPIREPDGQIVGLFCAYTDETERVMERRQRSGTAARSDAPPVPRVDAIAELDLAQTALFSSVSQDLRAPLALIVRRMLNVDGVSVLLFEQATGTLLDANDFFFEMFGYTRADVAARALSWHTLTPPEHVAISEAQLKRLASTGHMGPYEKEYLRKDGSRSWMVFAGASLGNGTVVKYCIDVSERKRSEAALRAREDALRDSEARLQRASQAKDDFLGTLGHELRTPLAAITLWARVVRSGAVPPEELGRALDLIIESAATQTRLVDDLLDLSRLASGKLVLSPIDVLVDEAARSAVELLHPAAEAKGVRLALEVAPELGRAVIDVARLRQVLWNLLSNSIKFTPSGGAVTLRLGRSRGALEVEVSDTGDGIAPDFMPHLFERFSQADMSVTRPHGGLGIGLALCRHLVELQGGTIDARSDGPGRGATFRVRLPWVDPEPLAPAAALTTSAEDDAQHSLQGVSVLLVEDDEYTLAGMQVTLERAGAHVIALRSAVTALATFEALDPATRTVLVSDMILPAMSGYELIERISTLQRARGLPAISACAVSGHARDDARVRAIAAGFDMYLVKPVTPERLVEAVVDLTHIARVAGT